MADFLSYVSLVFSGVVALMFIIFIVYFLEYGYGEGEAGRRAEAVSRVIWAASVILTVAALWVLLRIFTVVAA